MFLGRKSHKKKMMLLEEGGESLVREYTQQGELEKMFRGHRLNSSSTVQ